MKLLLLLRNPEIPPCIHAVQHPPQATGGLAMQMHNPPLDLLFSLQIKGYGKCTTASCLSGTHERLNGLNKLLILIK